MAVDVPAGEEIAGYFSKLSNWGRWGEKDSLGTLNHITPEKRIKARDLITTGRVVSCSRPITYKIEADTLFSPVLHFMEGTGEAWTNAQSTEGLSQSSGDFFGMPIHGLSVTHLDGLAHFFWDGKMYNGRAAALVTSRDGAKAGDVEAAHDGIVTRGVLLDIPRVRSVEWLELKEPIYPDDLLAAERAAGLQVEPGDALFVRTGRWVRRQKVGPSTVSEGWSGLHASCLPYLHERGVAMLGTDTGTDVVPSGYKQFFMPVHQVGLVAMGLWIMDAGNFEELAGVCGELGRWQFLLTIAPLRLTAATGSPVNPIAIL